MNASDQKPNIVLILNDDMGYSDLGCYGGEIDSKNLNKLAENGIRLTNFCNTARCCPSRASLLTGLHPHQTGVGFMVSDWGFEAYRGTLNKKCVTIAELLKENGYKTYMSGKWHVVHDKWKVNDGWPKQRGFDRVYSFLGGASSYFWPKTMVRDNEDINDEIENDPDYYITDAISDNAANYVRQHKESDADNPFFMYVAYTAPHWPLHAKPEDIEKYKGRFDEGWDVLREKRLERMVKMGIIDEKWQLTDRDPTQDPWEEIDNKKWESRRMEVYAAQIDAMDQGIGRIIESLKETGQFENTVIIFLADNGGCAERVRDAWSKGKIRGGSAQEFTKDGRLVRFGNKPSITPGLEDTYLSYGIAWANLSNTPFRMYKRWTHQGGIATPFIVHWPRGIKEKGVLRSNLAQLTDVMATIVEITGVEYPKEYNGNQIHPMEGTSLVPVFQGKDNGKGMLFFEHTGNGAVRDGDWKLVRDFPYDWELYNMTADGTEMHNLAKKYPDKTKELIKAYNYWAERVGVIPKEDLVERRMGKIAKIGNRIALWAVRHFGTRKKGWQKIINLLLC